MRKSQSRQHGAKGQKKGPKGPAPATPVPNPSLQPTARWQRTQRYTWDKGGSKGGRK